MFEQFMSTRFIDIFSEMINRLISSPEIAGYYLFSIMMFDLFFFFGALLIGVLSYVWYRRLSRQIKELKNEYNK